MVELEVMQQQNNQTPNLCLRPERCLFDFCKAWCFVLASSRRRMPQKHRSEQCFQKERVLDGVLRATMQLGRLTVVLVERVTTCLT